MKNKTLSLINVSVILLVALVVSFAINQVRMNSATKELPIFYGETMAVRGQKPLEAIRATKAVTAVKAPKAVEVPVPMPIVPPQVSFKVLPQYPITALEQGLAGTVLLSVYVGQAGDAAQVNVKTSSGVSDLDQAAVAAVSQWKFSPASQAGAALASWFEVPVRFEVK